MSGDRSGIEPELPETLGGIPLPPVPYPDGSVFVFQGGAIVAKVLRFAEQKTYHGRFYFGGPSTQWLATTDSVQFPIFGQFATDVAQAMRIPWFPGQAIGLVEVAIPQVDVQPDEPFTVHVDGIIDDGSNLLAAYAPQPLDGNPAISFVGGDFATKRAATRIPTTIGGVPVTHLVIRVTRNGFSFYLDDINISLWSAP